MPKINVKQIILWGLAGAACFALAMTLGWLSAFIKWQLMGLILAGLVVTSFIIKKPFYGVLLITFFLPFERIGSVDMGGVTVRPSQLLAGMTLIIWVMSSIVKRKFKFAPNPIFWPLVVFVLINIFALLNAPNLERSAMVLAFMVFTMSVAIVLPNLIKNPKQLQWVLYTLMFTYTLVTAFGIFQFLGDIVGLPQSITGLRDLYTKDILGFPRVQSVALEPLYFANFLLLPLCLILAVFLNKAVKVNSWILGGLVALGGLNLVLTVSRGAYIAFAVSFLILTIFLFKKIFTLRNIIFFIIIVSLVSFGAYKFFSLEDTLEDFMQHSVNLFEGASYDERVDTFEIAERAWQEHPVIGIGPGSFGPYAANHPYVTPADGFRIVNNEYLELLAESGILGLAVFAIIVLILIIRTLKAIKLAKDKFTKTILIGLLAAFIGILVQYNTFSVLYIMHIWYTIGLLVVVQNLVLKNENR